MKFVYLILLMISVIKCGSSCEFDNETVQIFWKENNWIKKRFTFNRFLFYIGDRKEFLSILNSKHPSLHCNIEDICNTRFSKNEKHHEECSFCEENLDYNYDYDYESKYGEYSFCNYFFEFEYKTKFVFLIDNLEIWLFSHRNVTVHSSQLINKSGNSFFNRR